MGKYSKKNANYKYRVAINQKSILDNPIFNDFDTIDCAVFEVIVLILSDNDESDFLDSFTEKGKTYYHISWSLVVSQYPLLKRTYKTDKSIRKAVRERFALFCSVDLLERYELNRKEAKSFFCKGKNYKKLSNTKSTKDNKHTPESTRPYTQECNPIHSPVHGHTPESVTPYTQECNNNSIDITEINNKKIKDKIPCEKEISKDFEPVKPVKFATDTNIQQMRQIYFECKGSEDDYETMLSNYISENKTHKSDLEKTMFQDWIKEMNRQNTKLSEILSFLLGKAMNEGYTNGTALNEALTAFNAILNTNKEKSFWCKEKGLNWLCSKKNNIYEDLLKANEEINPYMVGLEFDFTQYS